MSGVELPPAMPVAWRALAYFNVYRFLLSALFVSLVSAGQLPAPLGVHDGTLFSVAALLYLLLSLAFGVFIRLQRPRYLFQVITHVIADLLILTILMFASAGLNSGFGVLLVIAVAGGGALIPSRHSIGFFFAAVATLSVFAHEVYARLSWYDYYINHTQTGFLGIAFFVTAFISYTLAGRLQQSEALARRHATDLANVSSLNEHIVQRLQSGVIVLDNTLNIHLTNAAAARLLGISEHSTGNSLSAMTPELAALVKRWRDARGERSVTFKAAAGVDIQASFSRIELAGVTELLIFIEDVSTLRQRAQQLKLASLGRLTASIAHEIRNPLGAISHAGQLLSESTHGTPEETRLTGIIVEHAGRVNRIIENVMNISRRDQVVLEEVSLGEWVSRFSEEFRQRNALAEHEVQVARQETPIAVQADPQQLHQIVWNVCENGIRYSQHSPLLTLHCGVKADTDRPYLDIIDTGPGIAKENQERLFEPFFTTNNSGSGLGLYIARELAEVNQATLSLMNPAMNKDEPLRGGCCFRLTFSRIEQHHTVF